MSTARQYATVVPPSMPSAFVLQWTLEVAAEVAVQSARHHPWVVDPGRSGLSFALQPTQLYPIAAQFRRPTLTPALLDDRLEAAWAAYRVAGVELALGYRADAKLGERTRLAMVDDVWAMALARSRGEGPPQRGSCCFIYVLPGVHECSGCPRLASSTRHLPPG